MYHQQINTFIKCKQLNGLVLKLLKLKRSGPKSEKENCSGRVEILLFCFGSGGARAEFHFLFRAEPEKFGLCRPLSEIFVY